MGYTQEELADFIGGSQKQVWRYESGNSDPSVGTLLALAEVLNTSTDWLLGRTGNNESRLSDEERLLLNIYRSKSPEKQETILTVARAV